MTVGEIQEFSRCGHPLPPAGGCIDLVYTEIFRRSIPASTVLTDQKVTIQKDFYLRAIRAIAEDTTGGLNCLVRIQLPNGQYLSNTRLQCGLFFSPLVVAPDLYMVAGSAINLEIQNPAVTASVFRLNFEGVWRRLLSEGRPVE